MKKIVALLLCFSLFFGTCVFSKPILASASTQSELEEKSAEIDRKIKENEKKLKELKDKKKDQQEYLNTLEEQIKAIKSKVDNLQSQVSSVETEISGYTNQVNQLNKEIKQLNTQIKSTRDGIKSTKEKLNNTSNALKEKLRSDYMYGSKSTMEILMGSDSLASFLTKLEMMRRISEENKRVIITFKENVASLQKLEESLESDKADCDEKMDKLLTTKTALTERKSVHEEKLNEQKKLSKKLEKQYTETEALLDSLNKSDKVYQNYIAQLQNEKKQADEEIDKIISEYYATSTPQSTKPVLPAENVNSGDSNDNSYTSGETWAWPLGNQWCYISSGFGNRDASVSGWSFHGGIDLAGGNGKLEGKKVYATRGGTVIKAQLYDNGGYGIYAIIDHGDGYSSLYGHMKVCYVQTGQTVQKGQLIGLVGDTGNSRGAHLHFEVRYNGVKQNPLNYVKNPNK